MKALFLIILATLGLSLQAQHWTQKSSLPSHTGVVSAISFSINGKLYVGGGYQNTTSVHTFFEYDPITDTWTQKADMPDSIYGAGCFVLNGKGYATCGADPALTTQVYCYDPATNRWQTKNPFPGNARQSTLGFSLNGKGYMCGGFIGGSACGSDMWRYNDTTDTWAQMASIPGPGRNGTFYMIINGKAYVGLGSDASGSTWYSDFYYFNPDSNTYSRISDLPVPCGGCVNFVIGQTGYVGLGYTGYSFPSAIYKYDQVSNSWSQADTFTGGPRFIAFSEVVAGKPYIGCGRDSAGTYYFDNWTWACADATITGHGDTLFASPGTSYQWYENGSAIADANHSLLIVKTNGDYTVEVSDSNSCSTTSSSYSVTTSGIIAPSILSSIDFYPNPINEVLIVHVPEEQSETSYTISDMAGRVILRGKTNGELTTIIMAGISSGVYVLHLGDRSFKVIKN
jgi:N-acetylneuraminic acid mutarotase